jgi:hypothetical protein
MRNLLLCAFLILPRPALAADEPQSEQTPPVHKETIEVTASRV